VTTENEWSSSTGLVISIVNIHRNCAAKSSSISSKGKMYPVSFLCLLISRNVNCIVLKCYYECLLVMSTFKEKNGIRISLVVYRIYSGKMFLERMYHLHNIHGPKHDNFQNKCFHLLSKLPLSLCLFICIFGHTIVK
jgi:hypothetical protein